MFGYIGDSREEIALLFRALQESARTDPLFPPPNNSHRDGWGFTLYSEKNFFYQRFVTPVFDESNDVIPDFSGKAFTIFHARALPEGELVGDVRYQHPFFAENNNESLFLSHNGGLKKDLLAKKLEQPIQASHMVDSEVGLRYIIQEVNTGRTLKLATGKLETFTGDNSALNLLILRVPRNGRKELYAKQFYNRDPANKKDKTKYYQLKFMEMTSGIAVFSSSLAEVETSLRTAPLLEGTDLVNISSLT